MAQSKSNFISYISGSVAEPRSTLTGSRKATFKSYITNGDVGAEETVYEGDDDDTVRETASKFFDDDNPNMTPLYLPGEKLLCEVDSVLKFTPYSDGKQGMSGKLCLTNFKLSFVTADRSSYDMPGKRQRNKLIDDTDIPLALIGTIFQVSSGDKSRRKKLVPGGSIGSNTKILELHCKDFRIHKFSFKFSPKDQTKKLANMVVYHTFINKEDLIFANVYGRENSITEAQNVCEVPMFDTEYDWEQELRRCKCTKSWRVCTLNQKFELCQSLPKYFVVPEALFNPDISRAAPQFRQRRIPTWCYTHINKNSLVRMSKQDSELDHPQFSNKMVDAVKVAGSHRNSPKVVDLAELCPSCKEVQESFTKLQKLCMSDTQREFVAQDMNWYSSLDNTKWLSLVSRCLQASKHIADIILEKRTVIVEEAESCDFACLECSLVQILLDPHYRTQVGFEGLVQKEWVRMGHPFQTYLGLVTNGDTPQTPIFLLFLDCVWQLLQQFPSCFEFTETYLTTLWDTSLMGLFDTFLFNNDHQRHNFTKFDPHNIRHFKLPTSWKWDLQFNAEDRSFFKNPLYILTHEEELKTALQDLYDLDRPLVSRPRLHTNSYSKKLCEFYSHKASSSLSADILVPSFSALSIQLWKQCYLRWQSLAQILSGGAPSLYLQQCHMVEEIIQLNHKAKVLKEERKSSGNLRPCSELIFGHRTANRTPNLSDLLNATYLTSSFPFSSDPAPKNSQLLSFTPTISVYLAQSTLEYEKLMEEQLDD